MMAGLCWRGLHQRQTGHGTYLQLELRHRARVLCVVAAVVRARGHFVDHQGTIGAAVVDHKKLDAEHAHVVQVR
jgi:hypothetical protein